MNATRAWLLGVFALSASGCAAYQPGELLTPPERRIAVARTVGCLDVRLSPVSDRRAHSSWTVVRFEVGNRCNRAAHLDLSRARVYGRVNGAQLRPLPRFDPRGEVRAGRLDGRARAEEVLAFEPPIGLGARPSSFCVDVSAVTDEAERASLACFSNGGPNG